MSSPKRTRQPLQPSTPPRYNKASNHTSLDQQPHSQPSINQPTEIHDEYNDTYNELPDNQKGTSFSPSKARAQAKITQQTTIIKTWLANLFPAPSSTPSEHDHKAPTNKSHPLISRWETEYISLQQQPPSTYPGAGPEILLALQDTMYANQAADSHRRLVHEARQEELDRLQSHSEDTAHSNKSATIQDELTRSLSNDAVTSLTSLAEMAVMLGCIPGTCVTAPMNTTVIDEISTALIDSSTTTLGLNTTISTVTSLISTLTSQLQIARDELAKLEERTRVSDHVSETLQTQTSQWQREMKQISLKIQEYNDRIATLSRTQPGTAGNDTILVEDVVEVQRRVRDRRDVIAELEEKVKMFNGLPADLEASRKEVQRAKTQLADLKSRREELFGQMANTKRRTG